MKFKTSSTQTEILLDAEERPEEESERVNKIKKDTTTLPSAVLSYFKSNPKIVNILPKTDVIPIILQMLVEKIDVDRKAYLDGVARPHMLLFLKTSFAQKYGLSSLADYHVVELLKSVLYHHQELPNGTFLLHQDPHGGKSLPILISFFNAYSLVNLNWMDARIFLFCRLCGLINESNVSYFVPEGINFLIDIVGDLIEVDPIIKDHEELFEQGSLYQVEVKREVAIMVLNSHFDYLEVSILHLMTSNIREAPVPYPSGDSLKVNLDWVLSTAMAAWINGEKETYLVMKTAFRNTISIRPTGDVKGDHGLTQEEFISTVLALDTEGSCAEAEMNDLYNIICCKNMLSKRKKNGTLMPKIRDRRRPGVSIPIKNNEKRKTGTNVPTSGVGEMDFVEHVGSLLRSKRPCNGIRTRDIPIFDAASGNLIGSMGRAHIQGVTMSLKEGLTRQTVVSICKGSRKH